MRIFIISVLTFFASLFFTTTASAQAVQGNDFWFMLPSNLDQGGNNICNSNYRLILVSQFCVENEILLECEALGLSNTYSIESGEYFEIDLSQLEEVPSNQIITPTPNFADGEYSDISFHLTSPQPVQAFLFVDRGLSAEGETLIPTSLLGNQYVPALRGQLSGGATETHILATENNTQVQVQGFGLVGVQNILLNRGEIFSFLSDENCNADVNGAFQCNTGDGTVITSDKKVTVFASNQLATIGSAGNGDMIMSTFLPVSQWSNEYYTGQNIERKALVGANIGQMNGSGDYIQITGAIGTTVTIEYNNNPARIETITAPAYGDFGYGYVFLDLESMGGTYFGDANTYITADGPVQVSQYTKGSFSDSFQGSFDATKADPEAFLVLPNSLWQSSYIFYQIASREAVPQCFSGVSDFVELQTLVIITDDVPVNGQLPTENIELNGINVGANNWIPFSPGSTKKIKRIVYGNTESTTVVSTIDAPFGITFYGSRERHSAIFSGGYGPIEEVNLCDQCADFDIVQNGSACINEPVPFSPVIYSFTEPNSIEFNWNFGDGTTSTERNPTKTYNQTGVFTVTLTISDGESNCSIINTKQVFVNEINTNIEIVDADPDSVFCLGDILTLTTKDSLSPKGRQRVQVTNSDSTDIPDGLSSTGGVENGQVQSFGSYGQTQINVLGNYQAGSFVDSICLNIQHPRVDELHGYLTTPWGARYDLFFDLKTNGRGNMRKTCFSPSAVTLMNDVEPPYTGTFTEYSTSLGNPSMWVDITSREPVGVWTLSVGDDQEFNAGFIADWSLYINTENGVRDYTWTPKNLLVQDNIDTALYTTPSNPGFFTINTSLETFNGCTTSDSITLFRDRDPIHFPMIDTVICSTADSLVLDSIFSRENPEFRFGGIYTALGADPGSVFVDGIFYPEFGKQRIYNIRYLYDYECGTDTAEIHIALNVLPDLGADSSTVICGTLQSLNLNDFLVNDDINEGVWSSTPFLDSIQLDTAIGILYPINIDTGFYDIQYQVDLEACAVQSVNVGVQINKQLSAGVFNDTLVCEQASGVNLLELLNGNPDDGGIWTESNFSAAVNQNVFNLRNRSNSGITTYNFTYSHLNQSPCLDDSAKVEVRVSNAPVAELIPDFPIICRDSSLNITVNITGENPSAGFNLTISDGNNTYPAVNTGVMSGVTFNATLQNQTTFSVIELSDNTSLGCESYESLDLVIPVFGQLFVDLVEERCEADFSSFTPIIEITGGDSTAYFYDLFVNGVQVKSNELVQSLPLMQDTIPNGSIYEYRFTDLSNCEDSRTSFLREPPKYCECVTFPGTMNRTRIDLCENVVAVAQETQGAFLETVSGSEDTLFYILHNTAGIIEGIVYDTNTVPEFSFIPGVLQYDVEYYISAIAGNKIPDFGYVDPADTCIAVNRGTPVVWRRNPELVSIESSKTVCFGETASIAYSATGKAPFILEAQYQVENVGPLVDTNIILSANSGELLFTLPKSRQFFINRISDANSNSINIENGNACFKDVFNTGFAINVNPLPEIRFESGSDTIFGCEGENINAQFIISGQAPFNLSYLLFGELKTITNFNNDTFTVSVDKTGFIELVSISDLTGCFGTITGNKVARTEFRKRPNAKILTNTNEVCGNQVNLEAMASFGKGLWTAELGGTVSNSFKPSTKGIANFTDTALTFTWSESNPPCPSSSDEIEVFFRLDPQPFAGNNDTICGLNYIMQAEASIPASRGIRNWIQIGNSPRAIFSNTNIPNPSITVPEAGRYTFVYQESVDGICINSDTVKLLFVTAPQITVLDTICDNITENYAIVYSIQSLLLNDVETNGSAFGNNFRISAKSGETIDISATLNIACAPSSQQSITYSCPCISNIGIIRSDTVRVCESDVFSFVDVPLATLDANDTLLYVLKESPDASNLNDVIYASKTNKYSFTSPSIISGRVYYAMVLVGNANPSNSIGIDFNDRCRVATPPVPLIVEDNYDLFFPSKLTFCEGENQLLEVVNVPDGIDFTVTTAVNGVLRSYSFNAAAPFLPLNLPVGQSFLEIGVINTNTAFNCADKNLSLIEVNVTPKPSLTLDFDDAVCVGESTVIQLSTATNLYEIVVDGKDTLNQKNNIYTYTQSGTSTIRVEAVSSFGCTSVQTFNVSVQDKPTPQFQLPSTICFPNNITARVLGTNPDVITRQWLINGKAVPGNLLLNYVPESKGIYNVTLRETTSNGCFASTTKTITVNSPSVDFSYDVDTVCSSDLLKLKFNNTTDVESFVWTYSGYINGSDTINNIVLPLDSGDLSNLRVDFTLRIQDAFGCEIAYNESVIVNYIKADFAFGSSEYCFGDFLSTSDLSINNNQAFNEWTIGNKGTIRTSEIAGFQIFQKDTLDVTFNTRNMAGCTSSITKSVPISPLPVIKALFDTVCPNVSTVLQLSGAQLYDWSPASFLDNPGLENPRILTQTSQTYFVTGKFFNGCTSVKRIEVPVYDITPLPLYNFQENLVVGDTFRVKIDPIEGYTYTWFNNLTEDIICVNCIDSLFTVTNNVNITVFAEDIFGCFSDNIPINLSVEERFSLDFPDAFTPNGDGINDFIRPEGLGIDEYISIQIYNRTGALIFEGGDEQISWDGKFKGKPQPAGTFTFKVIARYVITGKVDVITGTFDLLR